MGAVTKKFNKTKNAVASIKKTSSKGRFVVIPADKVEADRCRAYAYIF